MEKQELLDINKKLYSTLKKIFDLTAGAWDDPVINEDLYNEMADVVKTCAVADNTDENSVLPIPVVNLRFSLDDLQTLSDKLWDVQDEGPIGEGWKSDELEKLLAKIDNAIENAG